MTQDVFYIILFLHMKKRAFYKYISYYLQRCYSIDFFYISVLNMCIEFYRPSKLSRLIPGNVI